MNLGQMRQGLLDNVFDDGMDALTVERGNRFINTAMHHIANWADALDQGLFRSAKAVTIEVGKGVVFYTIPLYHEDGQSAPSWRVSPDFRFRRLLRVDRTNYPADPSGGGGPGRHPVQPLPEIKFEDMHNYNVGDGREELPPFAVSGRNTYLVYPIAEELKLEMHYVFSLPDMVLDTDTPGERNEATEFHRIELPVEYHPLLVAWATVLWISAENGDGAQWRDNYKIMRDEMLATLKQRRGKP